MSTGPGALEPVGAAPARGHHGTPSADLARAVRAGDGHASAPLSLDEHLGAFRAEEQVYARLAQVALDTRVQIAGALGAEMAQRAIYQLETRFDSAAADLVHLRFAFCALHAHVGAEAQVHAVHFPDGVLRLITPDEVGQVAAYVGRQRQLSVRERSRAREPRRDTAGFAVRAWRARLLRAYAILHRQAFVHHDDAPREAPLQKGERAENTGGARPHDDHVGVDGSHKHAPVPAPFRRRDSCSASLYPSCRRLVRDPATGEEQPIGADASHEELRRGTRPARQVPVKDS